MPTVLDRSALEESPLADLHLLADELGVDGFRRLRKTDLVDAILARQSGGATVTEAPEAESEEEIERAAVTAVETEAPDDEGPRRSRRGPPGGPGRRRDGDDGDEGPGREEPAPVAEERGGEERGGEERAVEGTVELLANGSGFLCLAPPEPTDDDIYISAAQVKRCELVSGDRISG